MKITKLVVLSLLSVLVLASCSEDDPIDPINPVDPTDSIPGDNSNLPYDHGFFVTNEGQFPGPGSITFVSEDLQTAEQHIFEEVNGMDPGSVIQSMFFDENGHAYIVANNSNLISVVNSDTFEKIGEVSEGLDLPRYGVVVNGKAYVTNQGGKNYVAVINLTTLKVEKKISMNGKSVERIIAGDNQMVYVQNGSFGTGNQVTIIDPNTNSVTKTLETAEGINDIAVEDNRLYALTATTIESFDLSGTKLATVTLSYERKPGDLDVEDDTIYFTVDKSVYVMSITETLAPTAALFTYKTEATFGAMYGFEVEDNRIYIADGGDFASDSFIEIHKLNGELLEKVQVGLGPNGFFFND